MANFEEGYAITCKFEGGYANNKLDAGGETYRGVARNFNPSWSGWALIDAYKRKYGLNNIDANLNADSGLQNKIHAFYKANYWDVNRLDGVLNQTLANEIFDIGVNSGVGTAAKTLQEALNLTNVNGRAYPDILVDGKVGPTTLQLANAHPRPALLIKIINALQAERYIKIMRANASQEAFAASWFSRV